MRRKLSGAFDTHSAAGPDKVKPSAPTPPKKTRIMNSAATVLGTRSLAAPRMAGCNTRYKMTAKIIGCTTSPVK